jgi:hypothetical protein
MVGVIKKNGFEFFPLGAFIVALLDNSTDDVEFFGFEYLLFFYV